MDKSLQDSELYEERFGFKARRSNFWSFFVILLLILALVIFRLVWTENFGGVTVSGSSMYKTLKDGEQLLMRYVDGEDAKRGDIVVVYVGGYEEFDDPVPEEKKTKYLIKRLIAIEDDIVRCTDGQIEICYAGTYEHLENKEEYPFVELDEPYAYYRNKASYDFAEYTVGEGEVFFLGDNRNDSQDSRYQEPLGSRLDRLYKASDIMGVVPQWAVEHRELLDKLLFWGN